MDRLSREDHMQLKVKDLEAALAQREKDRFVLELMSRYGLSAQDVIDIGTGQITRFVPADPAVVAQQEQTG